MKLAEALALRSDAMKRVEHLRSRAQANARYQEGEAPAENAGELVAESDRVLDELEGLIRRINHTNSATRLANGLTVTDALAQRDVLRLRHSLYSQVADAASGKASPSMGRQMRSELRYVTELSVPDLRSRADELAKQHRELDAQIQQANWEAELAD
jgi:hypothetical protein